MIEPGAGRRQTLGVGHEARLTEETGVWTGSSCLLSFSLFTPHIPPACTSCPQNSWQRRDAGGGCPKLNFYPTVSSQSCLCAVSGLCFNHGRIQVFDTALLPLGGQILLRYGEWRRIIY